MQVNPILQLFYVTWLSIILNVRKRISAILNFFFLVSHFILWNLKTKVLTLFFEFQRMKLEIQRMKLEIQKIKKEIQE